MMLTRLAVGLEPLNTLDAAHRSPRFARNSRAEVGFPVEPATHRLIKRNKELAEASDRETNPSSEADQLWSRRVQRGLPAGVAVGLASGNANVAAGDAEGVVDGDAPGDVSAGLPVVVGAGDGEGLGVGVGGGGIIFSQ
jgi:hypothetical protein